MSDAQIQLDDILLVDCYVDVGDAYCEPMDVVWDPQSDYEARKEWAINYYDGAVEHGGRCKHISEVDPIAFHKDEPFYEIVCFVLKVYGDEIREKALQECEEKVS